jgi:LPXTG-site transpeptidase (sortase) family protein
MTAPVRALATDNSGNLYAGGYFASAGGGPVNYVAKWDGVSWSALGTGMNGFVYALATDNSGNLYAAGNFTFAGGTLVNNVARWDGSSWSALSGPSGIGTSTTVNALATDSAGNLYAGGYFTLAGGIVVNRIAKWDGSNWSALGTGASAPVHGLATDSSGNLYAGGEFVAAGGIIVNRVAKWDTATSTWSALGAGTDNVVRSLAVDSVGNVLAGGAFFNAGGVLVNRVARWDGTAWEALSGPSGTGVNVSINAVEVDGANNVYAGGYFTFAGGINVNYVAYYDFSQPPSILLVSSVGSFADTGDGIVSEGETTSASITSLTVSFSEDVFDPAGNTDADDATNPANYSLIRDGAIAININGVSYTNGGGSGPYVATVNVNDGAPLPVGDYAFTVVGSTSVISDVTRLPLAGDGVNPGTDFVRNFTVTAAPAPATLPDTGFAPGVQTALPTQPAEKDYTALGDLWLEIPKLNVQAPIVGVPVYNGEWDVSWLGNSAGWLESTAYPTWEGNTVITGHVWDAFNNPGVFANINGLRYGDRFNIHIQGLVYTYEVRRNYLAYEHNLRVLAHSEYDIVTLLTCEGYNITTGSYRYRRVISAVLVDVQ